MSIRDDVKSRYGERRIARAADVLRELNTDRNGDAVGIPPELEDIYVQSMTQKQHTDILASNREDVGRMQAVLIAANSLNEKHKRIWVPESDEDVKEILELDSVFTTALYLAIDTHAESLAEEAVKN